MHYNEIKDELIDIAARAFIPSAVRDEPAIHPCRVAENEAVQTDNQDRGDILIRGLWEKGTDCIIDVRVTDTNAPSAINKDPHTVLETHEREKKRKYLKACQDQRRHFTPFVVSCDGLMGKEADALLRNLAERFGKKTGKSYSETCGFLRACLSIAIV